MAFNISDRQTAIEQQGSDRTVAAEHATFWHIKQVHKKCD
jgi:hypothetical protein